MSDEVVTFTHIVAGIYRGDKIFESLFIKKFSRSLIYLLEKRSGDPELARDICQETFLILLEKFRKKMLDEPEKLASYVHQTAVNILIANKRKEARRQTFPDSEMIEECIDQSPPLLDDMEKSQLRQSVRACILAMRNPRDRDILYYYYVKELEKTEICKQIDIDFRHFDKVISRARTRLREFIMNSKNKELLRPVG